jgi:hypothetical protein
MTNTSKKKSFALRVQPELLDALQRWADDELRSLNGQIEFVLRDALVKNGRVKLTARVVTDIELIEPEQKGSE